MDNLDTVDGDRTKTPAEAADTLAGFFQSSKKKVMDPYPKVVTIPNVMKNLMTIYLLLIVVRYMIF